MKIKIINKNRIWLFVGIIIVIIALILAVYGLTPYNIIVGSIGGGIIGYNIGF